MIYELGQETSQPPCSLLAPAWEAWQQRKPANAYRVIRLQRDALAAERAAGKLAAQDWLFAVDVFNACAMYDGAKVLTQNGAADHPEDQHLLLTHLWDLGVQGKLFECREKIEKSLKDAPDSFLPKLKALKAYNFSVSGWRKSGERAHTEAMQVGQDDPLAMYILSRAASYRSAWPESIETGSRAVELAPRWSRARATLSDALLAQGRVEEAIQLLNELPGDAIPFFSLGLSKCFALEALKRSEQAIQTVKKLLQGWGLSSRYQRFAARQLAFLQFSDGRDEEAEETIREYRIRSFPLHRKESGRKKLLSLPLVSQAHNHCVPTVAAMVAEAQGQAADPLSFARGMKTAHGTPLFRMIDFMREQGFSAYCVKPTLEAVQYFIDRNVPLIGVLNDLFSSHVDVICGYDTGLDLFHVRDPMHWYGRSVGLEHLAAKYRDSEGLWALVRDAEESPPGDLLEPVGEAFVNLARAVSEGERVVAEQSFAGIPDEHPLAFARDSYGRLVVLTETEYEERLANFVDWDALQGESPVHLEQLRAILAQISTENVERVLEVVDRSEDRLGPRFAEYIRCQCYVAKQEWREAQSRLTELSAKIPQVESMWRLFSIVEEQIGNAEKAEEYLENALDISPDDLVLNRQRLDLNIDNISFEERLQLMQRLVDQNPGNNDARWAMTQTMLDSGDGMAVEASLKESIRYLPRYQVCYDQLADWYLVQGRRDLASVILNQGRELVGDELLPKRPFELSEDEKQDASKEEDKASGDGTAKAGSSEAAGTKPKDTSKPAADLPFQDSFGDDFDALIEATEESSSTKTWHSEEAQKLLKADEAGELRWWQSARFRGYLAFKVLGEPIESQARKEILLKEFKKVLPQRKLPGVPELYVQALMVGVRGFDLNQGFSKIFLDWVNKFCKNIDRYPALQFERAFLLEQAGLFNDAEAELENIIQQHPAYSPSLYRKGQIASSRGDYETAIECHHRCVAVAPAVEGAWNQLASLYQYLEKPQETEPRKALVHLRPYSRAYAFDVASCLARLKNPEAGQKYLESRKKFLFPEDLPLLKARLHFDHENASAARAIIRDITTVQPHNQDLLDWLRVDCHVEKQDFNSAIEVLEEFCKRNEGDPDAIDQLVRLYREVNPAKAKSFALEQLGAGVAHMILAYVVCQQSTGAARDAIKIVEANKPEHRDAVALAFSDALNRPDYGSEYLTYLKWCVENRKHEPLFKESLASQYYLMGQPEKATSVAEGLLSEEPDDPRWLKLAGNCIQDIKPAKSLEYLEKEFGITGSSDTLVRIGRAHQLQGNAKKAIEQYSRALELNPYETLAITNLVYKYEQATERLYDQACQSIRGGHGHHDQYFLVCAIQLAKHFNRVLPPEWYGQAITRYQAVMQGDGFRDEQPKLKAALIAWAKVHGDQELLSQLASFWEPWLVAWRWPGTKWIPASL